MPYKILSYSKIKKHRRLIFDQQYKQEAAYLELSKRQREFQAREQFIWWNNTNQWEVCYLEQAEIFKINDVKERAFMFEMSRLRKQEEQNQETSKMLKILGLGLRHRWMELADT